jgi:hypothetical protein
VVDVVVVDVVVVGSVVVLDACVAGTDDKSIRSTSTN